MIEEEKTVADTDIADNAATPLTDGSERREKEPETNKPYSVMNLPNWLTVIRMAIIPVFVVLFFVEFPWHRVAALALFVLACVTDFFDGYIARKENMVTNFGKFLDPIADKTLVACALVAVCVTDPIVEPKDTYFICIGAFTMIIISRELIVSGFRIVAADRGLALAADKLGKIKTVLQMCALISLLLSYDIYNTQDAFVGGVFFYIGFALLAAATFMTLLSGTNYILRNKKVLEG